MDKKTAEQVIAETRSGAIEFAQLQFTDIPGTPKGVTIPASRIEAAFGEGVWVDGSAVEGPARVAEQDLYLLPDPATYAIVRWASRPTARLICDLEGPGNEPFAADPRRALRAALADAADVGYAYVASCEVEFSIFQRGQASEALTPIDSSG